MASYKVKANICLDIEDAEDEMQAKLAAIEQLGDFFRHNEWVDLLVAEKLEPAPCRPMDIYVVVGVYAGVVDSVHAFTQRDKAEAKLAEVKASLEIKEGEEGESENSADLTCVGLGME